MFNRWAQTRGVSFGLRETCPCACAITQGGNLKSACSNLNHTLNANNLPQSHKQNGFPPARPVSFHVLSHVSIHICLYSLSLGLCSLWLPSFILPLLCQLNQASQCFHQGPNEYLMWWKGGFLQLAVCFPKCSNTLNSRRANQRSQCKLD